MRAVHGGVGRDVKYQVCAALAKQVGLPSKRLRDMLNRSIALAHVVAHYGAAILLHVEANVASV